MHTIKPLYDEQELDSYLPSVISLIERVLVYSPENSLESVIDNLMQGYSLLWLVLDEAGNVSGVVTTKIINHPNYRTALIHLCAGDGIDDWIHTIHDIERWARSQQCRFIEIQGRPGWKRKLPEYDAVRTVFQKELNLT